MEYRDRFYRFTRDAIRRYAYVEIVYACYYMCIYEINRPNGLGSFSKHFNGFRIAFKNVTQSLFLEELVAIRKMYQRAKNFYVSDSNMHLLYICQVAPRSCKHREHTKP